MTAELFYTLIFFFNILGFLLYGLDKHFACYNKWRIPEAVLIGIAAIGGAYGAAMGMLLFRHKTKHTLFQITVPLLYILWLVALAVMYVFL